MKLPAFNDVDHGSDATFIGVHHEGFVSFRFLLPEYRILVRTEGVCLEVERDSMLHSPSEHLISCLKLYGTSTAQTYSGRKTRLWMFQLMSQKALEFLTKDNLTMKTLLNQFGLEHVVIFSENLITYQKPNDSATSG